MVAIDTNVYDDDVKNDETVIAFLEKYGIRVMTIAKFLQFL